ncbi:pyrin-like [Pelobates fuscus]|uniref:pyrin-like n=1 Tax=Pelobates fuscus TaxID=191477 RepID=UPI002FE4C287
MARTTRGLILSALDELLDADFRRFKNHLNDATIIPGFGPIPRGRLENADRVETANIVYNHFSERNSLNATFETLNAINQRNLADRLSNEIPANYRADLR